MDLLPSSEQEEIISASASFLAGRVSIERIREQVGEADPVPPGVWAEAAELGWFGLGLPESVGGIGCSLADEALLFREIGRSLAPGPFLATVLGTRVAAVGGASDLAENLLEGSARVGLAISDGVVSISAEGVRGKFRLLDAVGADHVLVADASGAALVAVAHLGPLEPDVCIDECSRLCATQAAEVVPVAYIGAASDPIHRRGLVLGAAMLVGIGDATRDLAAEHAKTRVQFGKPIGVHQAVKHPIADMAIRCDAAWAQTVLAALATDEALPDAVFQALCARIIASGCAERNAKAALQVMGGMGFTFEHDVNLFVKRAVVLSHLFGTESELLSDLLAEPAAV